MMTNTDLKNEFYIAHQLRMTLIGKLKNKTPHPNFFLKVRIEIMSMQFLKVKAPYHIVKYQVENKGSFRYW